MTKKTSDLPQAESLTGTELVSVTQGGVTVQTSASDIASSVDLSGTYGPMPEGTPEVGQVPIVTDADPLTLEWGDAGGAPAGVPIVQAFPFAFDTAGILTGAALYTPTVGDVLLDGWVEIDTAWDGTTPKCDVGTFTDGAFGWWSNANNPLDMTHADDESIGAGLLNAVVFAPVVNMPLAALTSIISGNGSRPVPGKFTGTAPIKIVVSQNGRNDGASPGSTQGSAVLYLITATPA